jgi:hypothetical protein
MSYALSGYGAFGHGPAEKPACPAGGERDKDGNCNCPGKYALYDPKGNRCRCKVGTQSYTDGKEPKGCYPITCGDFVISSNGECEDKGGVHANRWYHKRMGKCVRLPHEIKRPFDLKCGPSDSSDRSRHVDAPVIAVVLVSLVAAAAAAVLVFR